MKALHYYFVLFALFAIGCSGPDEGKPCFFKDGECAEGYYCDVLIYVSGSCRAIVELGEECTNSKSCRGALFCGDGGRCFDDGAVLNEACGNKVFKTCSNRFICDELTSMCVPRPDPPKPPPLDMSSDEPLDSIQDGTLEVDMASVDTFSDMMDASSDAVADSLSDLSMESDMGVDQVPDVVHDTPLDADAASDGTQDGGM